MEHVYAEQKGSSANFEARFALKRNPEAHVGFGTEAGDQ